MVARYDCDRVEIGAAEFPALSGEQRAQSSANADSETITVARGPANYPPVFWRGRIRLNLCTQSGFFLYA